MFVRDMTTDPINAAMVKSINDIGHVMGKKTIAEFVENKEILAQLAAIGVDFAQGYGLGKPAPMDELLQHHQPKNRAA
jgi:EAL domain-containing protein (putative c-di-GMP-specific phosphodiesterase class I)